MVEFPQLKHGLSEVSPLAGVKGSFWERGGDMEWDARFYGAAYWCCGADPCAEGKGHL